MNSTAYDIVDRFEKTIAEYAGAKYGVAVDSCCNAIMLCALWEDLDCYILPKRTYPGVACALIHAGCSVDFDDYEWDGGYVFGNIIDGALSFKRDMYNGGYHCLSFHAKKHLPIGRGGMILTDNKEAYEWFKKMRWDGRPDLDVVGYNCYMTPEQAARGLMLFDLIKDKDLPDIDPKTQNYPDLSKVKAYAKIARKQLEYVLDKAKNAT